jgi:hypothetical protein
MAEKAYSILGGNVTVLGNFNPAILRPEFIEREFSDWKLGQGALVSPAAVSLVADIRYEKVRLFMDPERMVVEDTKLGTLEEMSGPRIVRDYLQKLPYTPLKMIGLNLTIEVKAEDLVSVWQNVTDPRRVAKILIDIGHGLLSMTFRYTVVGSDPWLAEAVILAQDATGLRIQLSLSKAPNTPKGRVSFNGEFQDVATDRSRVDFLAEHFLDVSQAFFTLLNVLG